MLPIRDTIPSRGFPFVMIGLLIVNVIIFVLQLGLSEQDLLQFLGTFAVIPARLLTEPVFSDWPTLITSQFLHAGWLHIASNMLALFIFGDNVEDRLGHVRFLIFYLACGVIAALTHVWFNSASMVPALGASGSIAGIMAAYMTLHPGARVVTLVPIFFIPWLIKIPAIVWAIGWFATQLFSGIAALSQITAEGGVGFWAHVGGFVAGFILVWPLRRRRASLAATTTN